jgi:alanine racemase
MVKFSDLAEIMRGQILHLSADLPISHLLTDSRQAVVHPGAIFFAIKGYNHDGHQYLEELLDKGISNFVVEQSSDELPEKLSRSNVISVPNCIHALQDLAAFHRSSFQIPVIGITGSNAKTIVKEWLFLLIRDRKLIKSPKSYNSQIGVPLSVWQLNPSAEMAVFEAGVSQKGEMERLAPVIRPTIGIFTNIGTAHDAGFATLQEKIQEKSLLFESCETIIYRGDHHAIHVELTKKFPSTHLFPWFLDSGEGLTYTLESRGTSTKCTWDLHGGGSIHLPFTDPASIENALHCVSLLLLLGYSSETIDERIRSLTNIPHRLALKKGINNCYLVDDTYNNDLAGLGVALDFLNQQPHGKKKVLILSDIHQSSASSEELYQSVSERLLTAGIDKFYGIGSELCDQKTLFPENSSFYHHTEEFLKSLDLDSFTDQMILIKGARDFAFEKIVQAMSKKHHGTVLEINLDALTHNLNFYKSKIPSDTKIMVMVKAFAYGTGSHEVANLLQYHGVDYLGVAYADEGVELRQQGIKIPIMVMNPSPEVFDQLVSFDLEPEIYSLAQLQALQEFCRAQGTVLKIHLKLDTGMHRLGIEPGEIESLSQILAGYPLPIASIFSHLAAADMPEEVEFSQQQYQSFIEGAQQLEKLIGEKILKHLVNSAGILAFPKFHLDMIRLGIGLYGIGSEPGLLSISSLKTTVSQIKPVAKGETVGYNREGKVHRTSKIATIAIGYADGYDRRFSNGVGKVLIGDQLAPVIGNVCMDMTMIDVTDCEVAVGDQVVIFNEQLTIQELAKTIGTIPYELLTKVSERVKRVYYME